MDAVERLSKLLEPFIPDEGERMKLLCQILSILINEQERDDGPR